MTLRLTIYMYAASTRWLCHRKNLFFTGAKVIDTRLAWRDPVRTLIAGSVRQPG
jgi:hypothetical protein